MTLPPKARILDVRPASLATRAPVADSANIPLSELPGRLGELPAKGEPVEVADTGPEAQSAIEHLSGEGREARLVAFEHSDSFRPGRLWAPNPFLEEVLPNLDPGSALDIACGGGRESVFLASEGWRVTAIDNLEENLERGRLLARSCLNPQQSERIRWINMDASDIEGLNLQFDLIGCFFFLDRDLFPRMARLLNPGGSLVAETFTEEHRRVVGKPRSDHHVLRTNELKELMSSPRLERFEEGWHRGRHTQFLWAKRV